MKLHLPNSASLQNITGLLNRIDLTHPDELEFSMDERWVSVHPVVLSMAACMAASCLHGGGKVLGNATHIRTLPYLIRMGSFRHLNIDPGKAIVEHEESGRFIPITQIRNNIELKAAITDLVPLLHAPANVSDPIRYVFSEMVRNALEHSGSPVGAFVCAQYYKNSKRIAIGIADAGMGVLKSMQRSHNVKTAESALALALKPGITGTTSRFGGNEFNAGAGLFFTKSIATLSRNYFFLYSGDSAFRLMKTRMRYQPELNADPTIDPHSFVNAPNWSGTVVGIDLNIEHGIGFSELLDEIRKAYHIAVKQKRKSHANRIRFT